MALADVPMYRITALARYLAVLVDLGKRAGLDTVGAEVRAGTALGWLRAEYPYGASNLGPLSDDGQERALSEALAELLPPSYITHDGLALLLALAIELIQQKSPQV